VKLILDTSIMVAAIRSDTGASRRLLVGALAGQVRLLVSTSLLIEYEAVMTRPVHLAASGLNEADVAAILDAVAGVAEPIRLSFLWRPQLRDADDDMVLEAAANGAADAIVTFNRRDFEGPCARFGVAVLAPGLAVRKLELMR
jgi:putative PIN family toxin of toxin-antitoxin system